MGDHADVLQLRLVVTDMTGDTPTHLDASTYSAWADR